MACIPKQPGPACVVYFDLLRDDLPALFSIEVIQSAVNLWYVEVTNRRTQIVEHTTLIYSLKQAALAEAKIWMAPYSAGLVALP